MTGDIAFTFLWQICPTPCHVLLYCIKDNIDDFFEMAYGSSCGEIYNVGIDILPPFTQFPLWMQTMTRNQLHWENEEICGEISAIKILLGFKVDSKNNRIWLEQEKWQLLLYSLYP